MKKKLFKRVQAGLLTMVLIAGVLPTGLQPLTVHAATDVKTMNLNTDYLAPSDGSWDATNDHKVYFGQYDGTPTAFRVLKSENGTMMLDCDKNLLTKAFNANYEPNGNKHKHEWTGSDLEKWLNGADYYDSTSVFTSGEKNAILQTALAASGTDYYINDWPYKDYAANDYVYLLSVKEANELYPDNAARKKTGGSARWHWHWWWLRSADSGIYNDAGLVDSDGSFFSTDADRDDGGVSPAFNLNRASVIFTSANGVSKSSDTLTAVEDGSETKEWKLTLLDSAKTVKVTDGSYVTKSGDTITVPYTYTGSDVSQISVMITSGAYDAAGTEILYYGKLNTTLVSSGIGIFELPTGLPAGYKMYILAEDVNGENYTDYASAPVEITVTEETKPEDIKYEITAGADKTVTENFDGTVTITCNGELSKFVSVSVDGKTIDSKYCTLKSGSTILTFTKEYVEALSVGKHTVRFTYTDGYTETSLTIKEAQSDDSSDDTDDKQPDNQTPDDNGNDDVTKTGDNTPIAWLFALILIFGTGLCIIHKKKAVRK